MRKQLQEAEELTETMSVSLMKFCYTMQGPTYMYLFLKQVYAS